MATPKTMDDLLKENEELKTKLSEAQEALKKYTNGDRHKRYYQTHKEDVKARAKVYMEKVRAENPEKIKEWRRNAKKKE